MPDIVARGVAWEMKSPTGNGKNTIKNIVQNASHQSVNIILDLRRTKIEDDHAMTEIKRFFELSKRIRKIMVITKSEEMIDFSK